MSENALLPAAVESIRKKDIKKQVSGKLAAALEEYRKNADNKAFGISLKKAGKLFSEAIVKKSKKAKPVVAPLKKKKEASGKEKKSKIVKEKK